MTELEGDQKDGAVEFIESKLPLQSERKGDLVTFVDKSARTHIRSPEIRTYMKRYLHSKDLRKEYRVLSDSGSLKFVKQNIEEETEEK